MTPRQGPTKKLIPAISSDSKCPHAYSEDDGLQLDVDCSECQGAQDLDNRKCVSGILNVIAAAAAPDAIVLKRYIHKRYRGESVKRIVTLALELASISRAVASAERPSDRRCRTCPASTERVLEAVRRGLLEHPETYSGTHGAFDEDIRAITSGLDCTNASKCRAEAVAMLAVKTGGM